MHVSSHTYHDFSVSDPPHQPMYLRRILWHLEHSGTIANVLDAGCGDGNFSASLAEAGYNVFGLDLSEGGIRKASARRAPRTAFAVASVEEDFRGVFPSQSRFDAVVSVEVIEHLHAPRRFVRSAYDALKPGGLILVTTPYWGYLEFPTKSGHWVKDFGGTYPTDILFRPPD